MGQDQPSLLASVDGALLPPDEAKVSVFDRGFRSGEGVFETIRVYGDHPFRLDAHLARAEAGAAELGLALPPREEIAAAIHATIAANLPRVDGADTALRLTVSAGEIDPASPFPGTPVGKPTVVVTAHRLPASVTGTPAAARAITVPLVREFAHVKSVSYLVAVTARRRARAAGADEALLVGDDGNVREAAASNVFAVIDGTLVTPPADSGLLAGVTRQTVLDVAPNVEVEVQQRPLPLHELQAADEALLTATTRAIVPLVTIDGAPVGTGEPGPITTALRAAYLDEVERERRDSTSPA